MTNGPAVTGQVVKESTEPVASGAINDVYHGELISFPDKLPGTDDPLGVWLGEEQVTLVQSKGHPLSTKSRHSHPIGSA